MPMADTVEIDIDGIKTTALVAAPKQKSTAGVVVTFHREGLDAFTAWKIDELAAAGFHAIAPNHYHVLPDGVGFLKRRKYLTDEQMARDLAAAARWLVAKRHVDKSRIAVLGPCMGGRTALVAVECNPELWNCGCIWYGGEVFEPLAGQLPSPGERERIERVACPLVGYFGGEDTHPSPEEVDRLDNLLTAAGKAHEFHRYPTAGHGFLNKWHSRYHAQAATDSWTNAIEFLHRQIDSER
jgi:carboxymethylenebutenolidase